MRIIMIAVLFIAFGWSTEVQSQNFKTVVEPTMLEKYDEVLKSTYPHKFEKIVVTDVKELNDTYSMINYDLENISYKELIYRERGKYMVIANYMEIPKEKVPKIVMDQISDKSKMHESTKYFQVSENYDQSESYAVLHEDTFTYFDSLGKSKSAPK